jgi:hypothetical protein
MYPIVRPLGMATTIQEVGKAMIAAATKGYPTKVIEIKDILVLAKG